MLTYTFPISIIYFTFMLQNRWNKLIQKPFEDGDERGLTLVQNILKPIMLRRTKLTTDKEGKLVTNSNSSYKYIYI